MAQKEEQERHSHLKIWMDEHDALVDFSDVAVSPCKDFYHVFVTENEVIFRWWKIVPPTRADSKTPPTEIRNTYEEFLDDARVQSEIERLAGSNMLHYLVRLAEGKVDCLMRLSDNVLKKIILNLELEDMMKLSTMCRKFRTLCDDDGIWEKIFRRTVETPVTPDLEILAEKEGWKRLFYTNKLQLQMHLRRQKREDTHGQQSDQQEAMDAS